MKKLLLIFIVMSSLVQANELLEKRSLLVQTYLDNQEELWKITKNIPPDFYLSTLGLNFPETNQVEQKAKSAILFLAANTALLEAKENLLNLMNCKKSFDKYEALAQAWSTPEGVAKNCPPTGNNVEDGVCLNYSFKCRSSFLEFDVRYRKMMQLNQKFTRSKFETHELVSVMEMFPLYWLSNILEKVSLDCSLGNGPKALAVEFINACKELGEKEIRDSVISHELDSIPIKKIKGENGITLTHYYNPIQDCRETKPFPRAPLYLAGDGGKNVKGYYCKGSHFVGILTPKQEILLVNSRTRAFYWLEMAEFFYVASKVNPLKEKDVKVVKLEGSFKKFSSNGLSFSANFKEAIKDKSYLNQLSPFYSDLTLIGVAYNSNQNLGTNEKVVINRLAQDLNATREMALNLKRDIQDLLIKGNFNFSFNLDHF